MDILETKPIRESIRNFMNKEKAATTAEDIDIEEEKNELSTTIEIERAILPAIANFMEKLDYELLKAYQSTPHNKIEYLQRLRDENKFLFLSDRVQSYMSDFNDFSKVARIAILKLDHLYYKSDALYVQLRQAPTSDLENKPYIVEDSKKALGELMRLINQNGTLKMKMRATMYMIYFHSIHNRFYEAKDLLLKSHISDIIYL